MDGERGGVQQTGGGGKKEKIIPALTSSPTFSMTPFPGGGGAAGAGVLGALLPGDAGGGGPGLVHPVARPQQPGRGPAAAAAQRAVGQRPPQQPGGSGGEWAGPRAALGGRGQSSSSSILMVNPGLSLCRGRAS